MFDLAYSFNIPEHGADRMGREGSLYEIAQWYPRMAVYDDVHGWNTDQYLGQGEFYLEYGDIDYEVTLPAGYIVAGTGVLQNPEQVLTPDAARAASPRRSSPTARSPSSPPDELASGAARPSRDGTLTWRFRAEQVRDVAWAASPDYLWDAVRLGRHAGPGVLPERRARHLGGRGQDEPLLHPGVQHALVPLSVSADLARSRGRCPGMEYPMVAMEAQADDTARALQRDHPRDRAHVVPDDGGLRRAALRLDGRGIQHLHQHLLRGGLLEAGRHATRGGTRSGSSPAWTRGRPPSRS